MEYIWLSAFVILLIIEAMTISFIAVWFAIGAFVSYLLSFVVSSFVVQLIVFGVVSTTLFIYINPKIMKYTKVKRVRTNSDKLIGKEAIVNIEINPINGTGQVTVDGKVWSAKSEGGIVIEENKMVTIVNIQGAKLVVKTK